MAGTINFGGVNQPMLGAQLVGDKLAFNYITAKKNVASVKLEINGNSMNGYQSQSYAQTPLEALRQ